MENFVGSITPTGKIEGSINAVPTVSGELNAPPYLVNNDYERLNNKPSINGETLIGNVEIDVPTKVSELENDSGFITGYTETDPTVPAWAKNPTKPTYTAAEVGALPDTTNIPTKTSDLMNDSGFISSIPSEYITETELSEAIADKADADDIPTKVSELTNDAGYITGYTETDPTVPSWAKQPTKPSYTAQEVGALPVTTVIPTKTSDLTNDSGFISSIPAEYVTDTEMQDALADKADVDDIPTKVSDLTNDAGYITGYTETDPTVPSWAKSPTKPTYTAQEVGALPDSTAIPTKTSDLINDSGFMTSYTETDPTVPSWAKQSTKPTYTASEVGALPDSTTIPSKTSDLTNDAGFITGMTILSYGNSTWDDFIAAYNANKVVYCRASSNANPATGNQNRLAFMAYVNGTSPTEVEFQYYRSVATHSESQQGDQVFVYKLNQSTGWSVTTREAYTKIAAGTGLSSSYSNGVLTLSLDVANGNEVSY